MMRRLVPIAFALAAAAPHAAQACSCGRRSVAETVAGVSVLFEGAVDGKAVAVPEASHPTHVYLFKVHRVWKGDVGRTIRVAFPVPLGGNCGVGLGDGERKIVGAYAARERNQPPGSESCTMFSLNMPSFDPRRPPHDTARELGPPLREYRH